MTHLAQPEMNVFVFQSVPDRYDLRSKLKQGTRDTWYATRYRNDMCPGDLVLFWMAGDEHFRGLYGWGRITSVPYIKEDWQSHGVDVIYEGKFDHPIKATALRDDPVLARMLIFRAPQASNFLLSAEEAKKLSRFLKEHDLEIPALKEAK